VGDVEDVKLFGIKWRPTAHMGGGRARKIEAIVLSAVVG